MERALHRQRKESSGDELNRTPRKRRKKNHSKGSDQFPVAGQGLAGFGNALQESDLARVELER